MKGIDYMRQHLGQQQDRDRDALIAWLRSESRNGDISIDPSITSWCAGAMNAAERQAGNDGTGLLNAQSFKTYGTQVTNFKDAEEGDIVIFHFPFDNDWQGHVTYFERFNDDNTVTCLGGNQNHSVNESNYVSDYIVAIRRPSES